MISEQFTIRRVADLPFGHWFRLAGRRHAGIPPLLMLKKLPASGVALVGVDTDDRSQFGDRRHLRLPGVGTVDLWSDAVVTIDLDLAVDAQSVWSAAELCETLLQVSGRPPMSREMFKDIVSRRDDLPSCDLFFSTNTDFDWT